MFFQTTDFANLDFETFESMDLTITAMGSGAAASTFSKVFKIELTDVNEDPTDIIFDETEVCMIKK